MSSRASEVVIEEGSVAIAGDRVVREAGARGLTLEVEVTAHRTQLGSCLHHDYRPGTAWAIAADPLGEPIPALHGRSLAREVEPRRGDSERGRGQRERIAGCRANPGLEPYAVEGT